MRIRIEPIFESRNKIFMPLTKTFVGAKTPRRKAIKLGAIEINIENFYVRLNLDCTISKYERLCFSLKNNSIIDILRKKFQENKKPIRHRCGLVKCGGLMHFTVAQAQTTIYLFHYSR